MPNNRIQQPEHHDYFLPDFCSGGNTLVVVLIAELIALMLVLAQQPPGLVFWTQLAVVSLFLQWLGLSSAALLCLLRRWLARLPLRRAASVSYVLLVALTMALSEAAWQVGRLADPDHNLFPLTHDTFLLRNTFISLIVCAIVLRYFYVQHQWKRNVQRESQARIEALQARIRPHFLFNSMNTIASLVRANPDVAERAIEDLADLFRASLAEPHTLVSFAEEMDVVRHYARLEQLRLGERLQIEWRLDAVPPGLRLPLLSLQPLLENAIYHGIEPRAGGGVLILEGGRLEGGAWLAVRNPVAVNPVRSRQGNQLALDNIRQRLSLAFGERARLLIQQQNDEFVARLELPLPTAGEQHEIADRG